MANNAQSTSKQHKSIKLLRLQFKYVLNVDYDEIKVKEEEDCIPSTVSIDVPAIFTLYELHDLIQIVFGWNDYHLHEFTLPIKNETVHFEIDGQDDMKWQTYLPETNKTQWISHEHPHCLTSYNLSNKKKTEIESEWYFDERAITIFDALITKNPSELKSNKLKYEYDFGSTHTVFIICNEIRTVLSPKDLKYPQIVDCNNGIHSTEDYNGITKINMNLGKQAIATNYADQWPLELLDKNRSAKFCYICRKHNECPRRRQCNGGCCQYCIKINIVDQNVDLTEWYQVYMEEKQILSEFKQQKINGKSCIYKEEDGSDCIGCNALY